MRKLNVSTLVTLDGVIQDPGGFQELDEGGWGNRYFDDEAQSYALEHLRESDAFLCGRVTFEVFKKFWPQVKEVNTPGSMSKLRFFISMSLDGFVAGPNQSAKDPLGDGGMQLHEWIFPLAVWRKDHGEEGGETNASTPVMERRTADIGAVVMGRKMFGGGPGPWGEDPWRGFWGEAPPFHVPVFVLTHHAREHLEMKGGTTYNFVTDGIEAALDQARDAAGGKDVSLAGGADVFRQYLVAGLVDELDISVVPVLLGEGERLFENVGSEPPQLEPVDVVDGPGVTHLRYRFPK
jgi:dihydrofolate reductase